MMPSPSARDLLREIARDPKGVLRYAEGPGEAFIETNGHNFTLGATPRAVATLKDSHRELVHANYIAKRSQDIYEITKSGYEFADACSSNLVI